MSTKVIVACTLVLAVLATRSLPAQDLPVPAQPSVVEGSRVPAPAPGEAVSGENGAPHGLSNWITYTRPECCGPVGGNGPIQTELYVRTGPSLPVEGSIFGHTLQTGWLVEGGGRSLFFNSEMDAAWDVDFGLGNVYNQGQHADIKVPINRPGFPTTDVSIRNLNRTTVNMTLGREWYLSGSAHDCGQKWRAGIDIGGRFGTARLDLHEIQHRTDVIGSALVALHTDWERPCGGCCIFMTGFRVEWDYTWMDILQEQNNAEVMDVNFLLTFGVRF
jgi:hypothetical protein